MISMEKQIYSSQFPSIVLLFATLQLSSIPLALSPPAEQGKRNTFFFFWQDTSLRPSLRISAVSLPHPYVRQMQMHHVSFMRMSFCSWRRKRKTITSSSWVAPFLTNALHSCLGGSVSALIKLQTDQTHWNTASSTLSALLMLHISIRTQMCTRTAS